MILRLRWRLSTIIFLSQIGLLATRDGLIMENKHSPYANVVVTRIDNMNDEKNKEINHCFTFKTSRIKGARNV